MANFTRMKLFQKAYSKFTTDVLKSDPSSLKLCDVPKNLFQYQSLTSTFNRLDILKIAQTPCPTQYFQDPNDKLAITKSILNLRSYGNKKKVFAPCASCPNKTSCTLVNDPKCIDGKPTLKDVQHGLHALFVLANNTQVVNENNEPTNIGWHSALQMTTIMHILLKNSDEAFLKELDISMIPMTDYHYELAENSSPKDNLDLMLEKFDECLNSKDKRKILVEFLQNAENPNVYKKKVYDRPNKGYDNKARPPREFIKPNQELNPPKIAEMLENEQSVEPSAFNNTKTQQKSESEHKDDEEEDEKNLRNQRPPYQGRERTYEPRGERSDNYRGRSYAPRSNDDRRPPQYGPRREYDERKYNSFRRNDEAGSYSGERRERYQGGRDSYGDRSSRGRSYDNRDSRDSRPNYEKSEKREFTPKNESSKPKGDK